MFYKNAFRLHAFLFILLAMMLSPTAVAKDRCTLLRQAQTAGAQVSGVEVSLEEVTGGKVLTTKTDEKGSFSFSDVGPGSYKLRIGCAKRGPEKVQDEQRGKQKCYAEFRIEITDKSSGEITGAIRKEG